MANNEILGVTAVERLISKTEYLEPFLNKNDREPSWDGYINAYHHAGRHSKSDMAGRVAVQVKGHRCESVEKAKKSFSVEMSDIKNYLQEGGTIFFVVFITEETEVVYYRNLLPYDLRRIIRDHGSQSSYTIILDKFPKDKKEIADLILNFVRDRDKQRTAISSEIVNLEQLNNQGMLKSLSFGFTTVDNKYRHPFDYFFTHDMYLYANLPFGISMPVQHIKNIEMAVAELQNNISVNGKLFYERYKCVHKQDADEIHFGKSIVMSYPKTGDIGQWKFNLKGTLSERIRDEEFIIAAINAKGATFGNTFLPIFDCPTDEIEKFNISQREQHLEFLKRAKSVLDLMHVTTELNCDIMEEHDIINLNKLISGVLDKNLVSLKDNGTIVGNYKIANLTLLMCCIKDMDSGLFRLYDFFDAPFVCKGKLKNGKEFDSSACVQLDRDALHLYSNICYGVIADQVRKVHYSKAYGEQLTLFMLEVLKAYDDLKLPTHPLLQLAKDIMSVLRKYSSSNEKAVLELNEIQISKREGIFGQAEIERLHALADDKDSKENNSIMTGVYLLLNEQEMAKGYYDKMTESEKKQFDDYPICLYRKWEETTNGQNAYGIH